MPWHNIVYYEDKDINKYFSGKQLTLEIVLLSISYDTESMFGSLLTLMRNNEKLIL